MIRAFWVWWIPYPIITIVPAKTAGKAKYKTLCRIRDAFPDASIVEMRAWRAPVFDALAAQRANWHDGIGWHDLEENDAWGCLYHEKKTAARHLNLDMPQLLPSEWEYPRAFVEQR